MFPSVRGKLSSSLHYTNRMYSTPIISTFFLCELLCFNKTIIICPKYAIMHSFPYVAVQHLEKVVHFNESSLKNVPLSQANTKYC